MAPLPARGVSGVVSGVRNGGKKNAFLRRKSLIGK